MKNKPYLYHKKNDNKKLYEKNFISELFLNKEKNLVNNKTVEKNKIIN